MAEPPIPGQQEIPVPAAQSGCTVCAWCGERAVTSIELEPAQYTYRKKSDGKRVKRVKLIKRHAIEVPVCLHHFRTLERRSDVA